ncbi:MAG: BatA domain-containing protein [Acidobacteria bacterium]|nr:BatA domain-containing protein [Acidobacteriota bacterium]
MNFLNPWFLIGAVAVAVPIIIHLVRREQAKRVRFPSLMFLRRIPQKSVRRRRLRDLLLLALRCLALLLVVLAFARPFIRSDAQSSSHDQGQNMVILLDTSYSMQYGNRFERARERARSLIASASPKDRIALIAFSQGYEIVRPLSLDRRAILNDLASLTPTLNATNYVQALRGAESVLQGIAGQDNVVALISDFQAAGWNKPDDPFALKAEIIPVDVANSDSSNLACVEVGVDPVVYTSKYESKLRAKLTHFSDQPQSVRIKLKLNDRVIEETTARLDGNASQVVEFTEFTLLEGSNRGTIEVEGDSFPLDNRFFFTIDKTEPLAILCLESAPGESFYLQQALAVSQNNPYALTVNSAGRVSPADLEKAGVIILNNIDRLDGAIVARLQRWVERGGGLIMVAGRRVDANGFNQTFSDLAPANLEHNVTSGDGAFEFLARLDTKHPVFAPFAEARSSNFSTARFYGYSQAIPKESCLVLARLTSGDPVILERSVGAGRVLLFASSLDTSWNDLPLSPMYVPLVHQMLRYLHPVEARGWFTLGDTCRIPEIASEASIPIDSPSEKRLTADDSLSSDGTLFTARENGFYRLRYPRRERYVAVNLNFRESDFRKLDVDEFIGAFSGDGRAETAMAQAGPESEILDNQEPGRKLWWPLLIAALVLFVLESVWAGRLRTVRQ